MSEVKMSHDVDGRLLGFYSKKIIGNFVMISSKFSENQCFLGK